MFLPVTFTYAVIAHRVVGVEVVIRQGLRYLLARNVLRGAIFLPIVLVGLRVVSNPDRTVSQILFDNPLYSALALAAAVALFVRDRLQRWLDRRFFRDAHDGERLLLELVSERSKTTTASATSSPSSARGSNARSIRSRCTCSSSIARVTAVARATAAWAPSCPP